MGYSHKEVVAKAITITVFEGDCRILLPTLDSNIFHTCITSPPYFDLRDYEVVGQIGFKQTIEEYIQSLVFIFKEVHRTLRDDGTLWLNIGDSYIDKNQLGIPWRLAFALQDAGWILRQDIIWSKPNAMPEPVKDRCNKSHEYLFLFSKQKKYYFDFEAIKEPAVQAGRIRADKIGGNKGDKVNHSPGSVFYGSDTRNKRSVWNVNTRPYKGAHFASFPPDLVLPCILAGSPIGGKVLDPFAGTGTTGLVASNNQREAVLLELNPKYVQMAINRIADNKKDS